MKKTTHRLNTHETMGFKVVIHGHQLGPEFHDGDILEIFNGIPDDKDHVLIEKDGQIKVEVYRDDLPWNYDESEIVGVITELRRIFQ